MKLHKLLNNFINYEYLNSFYFILYQIIKLNDLMDKASVIDLNFKFLCILNKNSLHSIYPQQTAHMKKFN
ncbi:hypothetical protein BpHYR1_024858 [Brachionus plicatilis]|uniref:Uncharacterized protein n=1 Tax=Brachionus plicatilis TaxID=10195 RepID=A0A3M7RDV6_BRAPC|nr:hypothetical protein BpHYR1_024858 [Brachionus plicatilis]